MNSIKFDGVNRIWSSCEEASTFLCNESESIGQILFKALSATDRTSIIQINVTELTELTTQEVLSMSSKIALKMLSMGIKQSDVIGIMASGTSYVMPVCFAAFFVGTPFQSIEISLDKESVLHLWNITKPKLIFCDGDVYDFVNEVCHQLDLNCTIFTLNNHKKGVENIEIILENERIEQHSFTPVVVNDLDATAVLCCSSGSTGPQKAVCWSHRFIKTYCLPLL